MRHLFVYAVASPALMLMLSACSNPAADKPEAVVGEARPVETAEAEAAVIPAVEVLTIDPESSTIGFVGSKVTGSHDGGFKTFSGTFELAPEGDAVQRINAEIDMESTWSDHNNLTSHLKNEDFFDVPKYPTSQFVTTEIKKGGEGGATHTITGNLTLRGVTKSISFPATLTVTGSEATLDSEFFIRRKDFGIEYAGKTDDLIRDEVVLKLAIKAGRS